MNLGEFRYRPEVDGLRAVAVLAVVLYHAKLGFPGGFVGVDVFFVISGYLISSLLLRDLETGRFSILVFWERRVRRILPAATFVVSCVLIAGWLLLLPSDLEELGRASAYQSIFAANVFFWRVSGYFAGPAEEKPLLHTWSLAVEEQFYVVFPWLLAIAYRASNGQIKSLATLTGLSIITSMVISQLAVERAPGGAFYLLPSRAWELLIGVGVALTPDLDRGLGKRSRDLLAWTGLLLIAISAAYYSHATPFPGLSALLPCLGTALFLVATRGRSEAPLYAVRLLSLRPMVFVGLISYSLYLIHWPLFAFLNYWALEEPGLEVRCALVGVSFAAAAASWRWVESPWRDRRLVAGQERVLLLGVLALASVGCAGLLVAWVAPSASLGRQSISVVSQARTIDDVPPVDLEGARSGRFPRFGRGEETRLLVWGDSHLLAVLPAIESLAAECDTTVAVAWHPSTAPLLGFRSSEQWSLREDSIPFNDAVFAFARAHGVSDVLLAARWQGYHPRPLVSAALERTLAALAGAGLRAWVLKEVPNHRAPVPKALLHHRLFGTDIERFKASVVDYGRQNAWLDRVLVRFDSERTAAIDAAPWLAEQTGGLFMMAADGVPLYTDDHHLAPAGAARLVPALRRIFPNCSLESVR